MKKILFLFLITVSFLNADYLVTNSVNSNIVCASSFSKNTTNNSQYIDITGYSTGTNDVRTFQFTRSIITVKSGYILNESNVCVRDESKQSFDLTPIFKILFINSDNDLLKKYENALITNDLSLISIKPVYKYTFEDNYSFCSSGYGKYNGSDKYMVSPEYPNSPYKTYNVSGKVLKKIQFNYSYNIINNECYLGNSDTAYDLPLSLGTPTDNFNGFTQPTRFQAYFELFKTANDLPNPNPQINDITIDITKASKNCSNELFTLQDKLLCEINNHLRKINQESNPDYSINNLIGILNTSHNNNSEAINKEIKALSGYEDIRAKEQTKTNSILDNLITNQTQNNTNLASVNSSLQQLNTTLNNSSYSNDDGLTGIIVPEPTQPIEPTTPTTQNLNLDKYFKADETINNNELENNNNDTDSLIDSIINTFTTFKTNITDSFTTINTQIIDTKSLIINPTNIFKNIEIVNCPTSYEADFSSFGIGQKTVIVDYCHYMSYLKPIIYFFTYLMLMIALITFSIRFIGVLL